MKTILAISVSFFLLIIGFSVFYYLVIYLPSNSQSQITSEISKPSVEINYQDTEVRDDIIVQGQTATAVEGKKFLIVSVKLVNNVAAATTVNTRNYIYITRNNKKEKIYPKIHNDPVEVQAISNKYARVGFVINDSDKDIKVYLHKSSGGLEVIEPNT